MKTITESNNALPIGYQLQQYCIQSIIEQNSFGITYLARNNKLNLIVVLKEYFPNDLAIRRQNYHVLPKSQSDEEHFAWGLEQFFKEGQALAVVQHPNIVRILSYFKMLNTAYLVMEYEPGQSLSSLLKSTKRLTEAKIMHFLLPLLSGLQTTHEANILHQDINPDNIYLRDEDLTPILVNFGMARYALAHRCRCVATTVNSGYAPVEQYQFKSNQGTWTDIYALGAILYRIVSGQIPVKSPARVHAIKQEQEDPLVSVIQIGQKHYSKNLLQGIDFSLKIAIKNRPQNIRQWLKVLCPNASNLSNESLKSFKSHEKKGVLEMLFLKRRNEFPQSVKRSFRWWVLAAIILAIGLNGSYIFYTKRHLAKLQQQQALELERVQQQSAQSQKVHQQTIIQQVVLQQMLEETQLQLEAIQTVRKTEQQQLVQLQSEKRDLQAILEKNKGQLYIAHKIRKKVERKIPSGNIIRDRLPDGYYGPEMIWLPAGRFRMGDIQNQGNNNEQPVHWVSVDRFAMGRYEVTFAEYEHFADITDRKKQNDEGWGRDNRPVINVSMIDAIAYAAWLSQQTGQSYRLPTEAEWEYAARAGTVTPWGSEIESHPAPCNGCGSQWDNKKTLPVGSFGANAFGLHDMGGNVREWTCSEYAEKYSGKEQHCVSYPVSRGNPLWLPNKLHVVERGGSWLKNSANGRVTARWGNPPTGRYTNVGFRLVIELD